MTAHDETVEKVARAIYEASITNNGRNYVPFDELYIHGYEHAYDIATLQAKAAIEAMQGEGWPSISPELIDKLNKLASYLTEQGEYEACDLIDTVVERLTPPPGAKP